MHTQEQRDEIVAAFAAEVRKLRHQPAMLFWSFGNELNGVWNGYLQQLGHTERDPCAWDDRYDDKGVLGAHGHGSHAVVAVLRLECLRLLASLQVHQRRGGCGERGERPSARTRARDPQPPRSAPSGSPLVALL